ncbi:GNAT family N-acetyltransferase [Actinoallomurus spadix]|uniref:N-acetyltransferase domain-containing protein n=1 Tax=Actinoallomurus spadix TaxID=79912 RepID=A0ABP3FPG9_9ACTN|nr:GNAT family N-acetyltransferase [Actinoallomurus spadix]MCO5988104.1 GNAT family N-acetyltransferase [Actinoallomurus spadix]
MPPLTPQLTVRPLTTSAEMRAGVEVYRAAFALSPTDPAVSPRLLAALQRNAGSVIGAFAGDELVGFTYGFLGSDGGTVYHYSQVAAVRPDWQRRGVGRALKLSQRDYVLAGGVTRMRWAFDPVRTHNAHFNLDVLGATGRWFLRDFYGVEDIGRDPGMRTDRLIVEWDLLRPPGPSAPPPAYAGWGETRREGGDVLLGAPRDWDALVARDRATSLRVRDDLAAAMRRLIDEGYAAISCETCTEDTAVYRFRPADRVRPDGPGEG